MKKIKEAEQTLHLRNEKQEVIDDDGSCLNVLYPIVEQKQKALQVYDEEILDLCAVEAIDKEIEDADEANARIVEILAKLTEKLTIKLPSHGHIGESGSIIGQASAAKPEPHQPTVVKPKLPKLTLERFKGDVTTFQSFLKQFNSTIHENPSIPRTDKFKHLKALLEGPATRVIQGLTLTTANYDQARKLLEDRYGKTQVIISAHMDNVLKLNPCTSDKPQQLRFLYDQMQVQIRGLESLGVTTESYGQLLIPIIMSKLPNEIRLKISRNTDKKKWEIQELSELIRKEIKARETTEHIEATTERVKPFSNFSNSGKSGNPATTSTLFTRPQENTSKGSTTMQCVFCGKLHFSASCEKVKDIDERK